MKNNQPTKSEIFSAYNKARAAARRAGDGKRIERLNKALGVLLADGYYMGKKSEYAPTINSCNCKDMQYRHAARRDYHGVCKHVEAERLLLAIYARRADHLFLVHEFSLRRDERAN